MIPSYGTLETKQLLSETFFSPGLGFRDIRLDGLKWSTLYIKFVFTEEEASPYLSNITEHCMDIQNVEEKCSEIEFVMSNHTNVAEYDFNKINNTVDTTHVEAGSKESSTSDVKVNRLITFFEIFTKSQTSPKN